MSAVETIKLAAAELNPDEQYELFRWWTESDAFRKRQLAALKCQMTGGLDDLNNGRYQTYDETNVMQLAEDIGRAGRALLKKTWCMKTSRLLLGRCTPRLEALG